MVLSKCRRPLCTIFLFSRLVFGKNRAAIQGKRMRLLLGTKETFVDQRNSHWSLFSGNCNLVGHLDTVTVFSISQMRKEEGVFPAQKFFVPQFHFFSTLSDPFFVPCKQEKLSAKREDKNIPSEIRGRLGVLFFPSVFSLARRED